MTHRCWPIRRQKPSWSTTSLRRLSEMRVLRSALQLGCVGHRAGAAAGTAHRYLDVLLLILSEIGAVEYLPRLLLKQLMQRKARGYELILDRHVVTQVALWGDRGCRARCCGCRARCSWRFAFRRLAFRYPACQRLARTGSRG